MGEGTPAVTPRGEAVGPVDAGTELAAPPAHRTRPTRMQRYVAWRARRIGEHGARRTLWRVGVALVGVLLFVGGIALVPLPGPGWVIVFVGLGVLATEFAWAEHLLRRLHRLVDRWTLWIRGRSVAVRAMVGTGCLVAVIGGLVGLTYVVGTPSWMPDGTPLVR